ncbi:PREDICTED: UNC93-like protein 1 [Theobroma cacao]|uniref:UNC93-like protein 1 n=1 Tax=Theobroma cacao TaxID=3641 RepID=A0AB32VLQ8_THECC|nr:PREDICTED: UNC93-like protein 1 [Theobroma cacao]
MMGFPGDEEAAAEVPVRSSLFRYNSPFVQVSLIGLVCFCCPGMFNALSGMGGGGQVDPTAANNANTALYTTFSVFGILGGGIYNIFGPRITLAVGCSTYVLYAGSFLYYNHHHDQTFPIIAGGLLGVGAGLLWAGQGAIMTSYPTPDRKGTYISLFWTIFNLGGVMGGLIPFILNYHRENSESVNDKTYITFMCFMSAGALISSAILSPDRVVRDDGTRCTNIKYSNVYIEAFEIVKLFRNWKLRLIIPAAWASNFFYTYQFNNFNGLKFNLRTRGLNNVFYWGAQMIGSVGIGYVLDFSFKSRRTRGLVGIGVVAVLGTAIWGGGLASQLNYSFHKLPKRLDFKNSGNDFAGPFVLYFCYGLLDAMFQSLVYWVIGALADNSETLSRYAGFYKGAQSAGAAVAWQVDKHKVPLLNQLIINWALTTLSYPLLGLLVYLAVKDDSKSAEDAETASGFPPPASIKDGYEEVGKSTPAAERDASQVPGKST